MLNNPTLVVVTDRNDLDNQLYSTFVKSKGRSGKGLLRQTPKQAETRKELKSLLSVESGGIVFKQCKNLNLNKMKRPWLP